MIVRESYFKSAIMFNSLNRLFMDVIRHELIRLDIRDINSVQAIIVYNIAKETLTVGEITNRRYYIGANVSYNLSKMIKNNYVIQFQNAHDRRSTRVKLSSKGLKLYGHLRELFTRHANSMNLHNDLVQFNSQQFEGMLNFLEGFWATLIAEEISNG